MRPPDGSEHLIASQSWETNVNPPPPETEPASPSSESGFDWWFSGCLFTVFLSVWTVGTVIFDLFVVHDLWAKFSGEPVFLVLFSIPFNAILVMLWSGVAIKVVVPRDHRRFLGTGIHVLDRGDEIRFRLPRITPMNAAFLAAFVVPILLVLSIGTATGGKPPLELPRGELPPEGPTWS
jgi:hypothetical protein